MTASAFEQTERVHGLDGLRGAALLLGVVLHATLSFFPAQIWIVADDQKSVWASGLFFVIHLFRMGSFFLIAGLFARMMLKRRGVMGFIKDRMVRIAGPLAAFWGPVLAGIVAVLIWNASLMGLAAADAPPPPKYDWTNIPLTHLWFLWVLLWLYAALVIVQVVVARLDQAGRLGRGLDRLAGGLIGPWGPLVLGAPLALALWFEPNWIAFFGIPTPDAGLVPESSALVGFGLAFGVGVLLDRRRDLLKRMEVWTPAWLGLALGAGTTALMLSGGPAPVLTPMIDPATKAMTAAAFAVATYASMFAVVGLALRFWSGHSALRRYLADASYWIYIVHLPLVMAAQVVVKDWPLVWPVKLAIVTVGVMAVCLASYELMVRHGFMGRWLNGRRVPWRKARVSVPVAAE
ncbi:acyltransferase family protein [Brevundimonas sp. 3P9-tot-E]|jgi:peptidoglycan/LPS O-acetylase OafA/YrhL|uniref:acyltransferase family protein n=1 Tax=Brevundimonas TaxID=41275 RepID=UPI001903C1C2|nr:MULTISPECIES: acyltransferase family protein [Brevundimonas]MBK1969119.1 acyltransferase family protein [Brevundimonas diminuta]MBK1974424.1 acyltransferase family protein [Brevundimonas diminuta]MDA0744318.1 acyltransferase family protein [Pseudomonadota bacterium]MDM8353258.1 acyltransferase family protein [Brevundimonas diminuta]